MLDHFHQLSTFYFAPLTASFMKLFCDCNIFPSFVFLTSSVWNMKPKEGEVPSAVSELWKLALFPLNQYEIITSFAKEMERPSSYDIRRDTRKIRKHHESHAVRFVSLPARSQTSLAAICLWKKMCV